MNSNVQLNYEEIVNDIKEQILTLKEEILRDDEYAPVFSALATYQLNDHVWYEGTLYVCVSQTEVTGEFNEDDWMEADATHFNNFYAQISPIIKDLNFHVCLERDFIKQANKIDPNSVYVAVRFGKAAINFGSSICNVYLSILGTSDKIRPTMFFFSAFASRFTTKTIKSVNNTSQIWVTPNVQQNFSEVDTSFRPLFDVTGTLIIGNNTVNVIGGIITYDYGTGQEDIPFMAFQDNYRNNLSPQPYGNTFGFAQSETNFSSYTFSISTYLLDTQLVADCMHAKGFELASATPLAGQKKSTKMPNDDFKLYITFSNGYSNRNAYRYIDIHGNDATETTFFKIFKLVDCGMSSNYGEIPMFTVSFSR